MLRRRKRLRLMNAKSGWLFVMMLWDVMGSGGSGRWWGELGIKYSAAGEATAFWITAPRLPCQADLTFPDSELGLFPPPRRSKKQEGTTHVTNQELRIDTFVKKTAEAIKISSMQGFVDVHNTRQPD